MRKIINRKVYDTETAEKLVHFWDGFCDPMGSISMHSMTEDLYRTTKGIFFLHGQGGKPYAKKSGVSWVAGEDIRPMTVDEVIAWLEERELAAELEALFPDELEEA